MPGSTFLGAGWLLRAAAALVAGSSSSSSSPSSSSTSSSPSSSSPSSPPSSSRERRVSAASCSSTSPRHPSEQSTKAACRTAPYPSRTNRSFSAPTISASSGRWSSQKAFGHSLQRKRSPPAACALRWHKWHLWCGQDHVWPSVDTSPMPAHARCIETGQWSHMIRSPPGRKQCWQMDEFSKSRPATRRCTFRSPPRSARPPSSASKTDFSPSSSV
mmetsp:Transcript_11302/g.36040  ORF Transcript_11302/g.36040 Transcript_11302/m.36040 type:complete len:216 (-) Transcript_11302:273-920(-)